MEDKIAEEIYDWAVEQVVKSNLDWHEKSLLFLAVKYTEFAESEYMFEDGEQPFWRKPNADSDLMSKIFGEAWNRLVQNGYAGGVKC